MVEINPLMWILKLFLEYNIRKLSNIQNCQIQITNTYITNYSSNILIQFKIKLTIEIVISEIEILY